tara:strand:+ start:2017 stop:2202 length:186 start_codon:yes stop_codon:yes gene_type:complete
VFSPPKIDDKSRSKKIKSFFGKRDGYHLRAATACARTPVLTETLEDFLKEIFGATAARAEN